MSGEESFVILDCSPSMSSHRVSLEDLSQNCIQDTPINCVSFLQANGNLSICTQNEKSLHMESLGSSDNDKSLKMNHNSDVDKSLVNSTKQTKFEEMNKSLMNSKSGKSMEYSVWNTIAKEDSLKMEEIKTKENSLKVDEIKTNEDSLEKDGQFINAVNISVHQNNIGLATASSLATSFILGENNTNDLKQASLYSLFPNLMKNVDPEEIAKLQCLICEVSSLRQTCAAAERTTKRYFNFCKEKFENLEAQIESLKKENNEYKLESKKQTTNNENQKKINELEAQYVELRDENTKLHQEVKQHNVHLEITNNLYQRDLQDMKQTISEKDALIDNMRHYMDKLKSGQSSWESVKDIEMQEAKMKEMQEKVRDLERQQATLKEMAEKVKSLESEKGNHKIQAEMFEAQLNGMQVNYTQSEEQLKAARDDIALLQAKDIDKENIIKNMRSEIEALKHQAEVYYSDFTMERNAREKLAGDRDKLALDLRALQHRNKQLTLLVEENSEGASAGATNMDSISSTEGAVGGVVIDSKQEDEALLDEGQFRCPVCCKRFYNTSLLQSHVNDCLDNIK